MMAFAPIGIAIADERSSVSSDEDKNSESTLTTISSQSQTAQSRVASQSKPPVFRDHKLWVPPLEDYIALGCIAWEVANLHTRSVSSSDHNEAWIEASEELPEVENSPNLWPIILNLWRQAWVRIFRPTLSHDVWEVWRVYLLPDDVGRRNIDRNKQHLKKAVDVLLTNIDVSPETWEGKMTLKTRPHLPFDKWTTGDYHSLFYLFNTLPSPAPIIDPVKDRWSRKSMRSLLYNDPPIHGLLTQLYPYQRRAAAEMLRREAAPQLQLDPRLEERTTPEGRQTYYYGSRDGTFLRQSRYYDAIRGGILAETMGAGKTLICLALVLATKGHWPKPPPQYADGSLPVRSKVGSLGEMAASTISRHSLPWRAYFDEIQQNEGYMMEECAKAMWNAPPKYEIPPVFVRSHRSTTYSNPSEVIQLCDTTIIVVPKNLLHQWVLEINKHISVNVLKLLVMEDRKVPLPPASELATYDVILFSRPRFENENKSGDEFYESPLLKLHWLRIIIDEGHSFSSSNTHAAIVAEKLVRAERRWVVSGTPAKDLMGVEVDMVAMTNTGDYEDTKATRRTSLEQRKSYNSYQEESSGAVKSLGSLASRFLKAQPWAVSSLDRFEAPARWEDYIYRHESTSLKTYTSFSSCLRRTLENLVIKTQPEDVERDITLPPLEHRIIRLEPSLIDKLTANLFVLLFTTNAVTSERRDQDYLFHKNSQHHLHRLISNLRQSAFFWTGMQEEAVRSSLDVTWKYLEKKGTKCTDEDRRLLEETANAAHVALSSSLWRATTQTSDMGMFMNRWPSDNVESWAFQDCQEPMAMSLSILPKAQRYLNDRLSEENPTEGFGAAGEAAKLDMINSLLEEKTKKSTKESTAGASKSPVENVMSDDRESTRLPAHGASTMTSPQKVLKKSSPRTEKSHFRVDNQQIPEKRRLTFGDSSVELSSDSELGSVSIAGTTSAKFSYLIDRVMSLYSTEKILIFYDGNHIAYFLAEAFDILNVKYLLYTNTLSGEQRGKYVVLFDTDPSHRVLIMDIKQAAHGLNLSSASRVFFVNPVCRPNVEAQAIKRAHRIGQTKPVHVETLILRGTVEEKMHERAAKMTDQEHLQAKTIEDDDTMARIIQEARVLPVSAEEVSGYGQMANLQTWQQVFGRPGRSKELASKLEVELFGDETEKRRSKKPRKSRAKHTDEAAGKELQPQGEDSHANETIDGASSEVTGNAEGHSVGYMSIFG